MFPEILGELQRARQKEKTRKRAELTFRPFAKPAGLTIDPEKITPEIKKQFADAFTGPAEA